jgi:hypothetical protein
MFRHSRRADETRAGGLGYEQGHISQREKWKLESGSIPICSIKITADLILKK